MKLKAIEPVEVIVTNNGTIGIRQDVVEYEDPVCIFLTLDQFLKIENWVFKNRDQIELLWNEGVEDDSNS